MHSISSHLGWEVKDSGKKEIMCVEKKCKREKGAKSAIVLKCFFYRISKEERQEKMDGKRRHSSRREKEEEGAVDEIMCQGYEVNSELY